MAPSKSMFVGAPDLLSVSLHGLSSAASSALAPLMAATGYAANWLAPGMLPDPSAAIGAYFRGKLTWLQLKRVLRFHGAPLDPYPGMGDNHALWRGVLEANEPLLDAGTAVEARSAGLIGESYFRRCMVATGIYSADEGAWLGQTMLRLHDNPSLELITKLNRLGVELPGGLQSWLNLAGFSQETERGKLAVFRADRSVLSPGDLVPMEWRGLLDGDTRAGHWRAGKWLDIPVRQAINNLSKPVPQLGDLIRMADLGQDPTAQATINPWLVERPAWHHTWARALGAADTLNQPLPQADGAGAWTRFDLAWATHWAPIDVGTAATWRDRIQPQELPIWQQMGLNPPLITDVDVRSFAKAAAVHPEWRDALIVASYVPLGMRQLVQFAEYLGWTDEQTERAFRKDGYAPHDARAMSAALRFKVTEFVSPWTKSLWTGARDKLQAGRLEAMTLGVLTRQNVQDAFAGAGMPLERIPATLDAAQAAKDLDDVLEPIKRIQGMVNGALESRVRSVLTRYTSQAVSRARAIQELQVLGVQPADATTLVVAERDKERARRALAVHERNEGFRLQGRERVATAAEQAYQAGLIDRGAAQALLLNAGWPADAIGAHLNAMEAEANRREALAATAKIKADYLEGKLTPAEATALLNRAGVTPDGARRRLLYWSTQLTTKRQFAQASRILGWVAKGLMPASVAQQRLAALGWLSLDSQLALAEASAELVKARERAAGAATKARAAHAAQLEKVNRQLAQEYTKNQEQIKRLTPLATLKKWLGDGIVTEEYVRRRMTAWGEPQDLQDNYIKDWTSAKPSKSTKRSKTPVAESTTDTPPADGSVQPGDVSAVP